MNPTFSLPDVPVKTNPNAVLEKPNVDISSTSKLNRVDEHQMPNEESMALSKSSHQEDQPKTGEVEFKFFNRTFETVEQAHIPAEVTSIQFIKCEASNEIWVKLIRDLSTKTQLVKVRFEECQFGDQLGRSWPKAGTQFEKLKQIKSLTIDHCQFYHNIINPICKLSNLEQFEFLDSGGASCPLRNLNLKSLTLGIQSPFKLMDFYPSEILKMDKLRILRLLNGTFTVSWCPIIYKLQNLTVLYAEIRLKTCLILLQHIQLCFKPLFEPIMNSTQVDRLYQNKSVVKRISIQILNDYSPEIPQRQFKAILDLKNLRKFSLNGVRPSFGSVISQLPMLSELDFSESWRFGDEGCQKLCFYEPGKTVFNELRKLRVNSCKIGDIGLELIKVLPLEELAIGDNQLTPAGMSSIFHFKNLRALDISNSDVDNAYMASLSRNLVLLMKLRLNNTAVGDEGLRELQKLRHLEVLSLIETYFGNEGLLSLRKILRLKQLHLLDPTRRKSRFDKNGIVLLSKLSQLKYLEFRLDDDEEFVPARIVRKLRRRLPATRIRQFDPQTRINIDRVHY